MKPIISKFVKFSFKKNHAIKAEVAGIRKKTETVLLAEFFFIKNININIWINKKENYQNME